MKRRAALAAALLAGAAWAPRMLARVAVRMLEPDDLRRIGRWS